MRKNANALYNLGSTILHQTVIGSNIRLAFSGIDDQGFDFIAAALQFNACREACAAKPGDAKLMNAFN